MKNDGEAAAPKGKEGARTGQSMGHYIIKGGRFDIFCKQLLDDDFSFNFDASPRMSKKAPKSKFKYTCPACKANAWAKSGHKLGCWNTDKCGGARMTQEEETDD